MFLRKRQKLRDAFILATLLTTTHASCTHAEPLPAPGTYLRPFSAQSPWNSRPINPVLGAAEIPADKYYPAVQDGAFSTGAFEAKPTDAPMTVIGLPGMPGIWNADAEQHQPSVTIPRWPADTQPAAGGDGHADILDAQTGIIHSFYQLKFLDGRWQARQYAWSKLGGRGWGEPAHYFQGSRSAGVPTSAGLIRRHEINDGDTMYRHALAMSLTYNGLSANPTYTFPATSADWNAATANSGQIPLGALLMLPPEFDSASIANLQLRKIVETLKHFGAYAVDRNHGTPFVIYVEMGSGLKLHEGGWNTRVAEDLQRIRAALRPVIRAQSWVDANGVMFQPSMSGFNLLSMRGKWTTLWGVNSGAFDTWQQALVFQAAPTRTVLAAFGKNILARTTWAYPESGRSYEFTANTTGGATARLVLTHCTDPSKSVDTNVLTGAQTAVFVWPEALCGLKLEAVSGVNEPSTVASKLRLAGAPAQ